MRILTLLYFILMVAIESLSGQCPDRDSVWNKIVAPQNESPVILNNQLDELKEYDKRMQACPSVDSVYTYLLMRIGMMYYRLGDFLQAIQFTQKSVNLTITNALKQGISKRNLIRSYYYLSIYYDSLKMESQQNEAADSCISNEMRANTDFHYTCILMSEKVRFQYLKGDYSLCLDNATLGETLVRKYYTFSNKIDYITTFATYKISALCSLKRFTEAENYFKTVQPDFLVRKSNEDIALMYSTLAYLNKSKLNYKSAIDNFQKAYNYDKRTENPGVSAEVLSQIGIIYSEIFGQHYNSLQYFFRGLKYANSFFSFFILGNIATVYVRMNKFDSAFLFFQQAFDRIKPGITEKDFVANTEKYVKEYITEFAINLVLDKGDAYLQQYLQEKKVISLKRAIEIYKTADELLDNIKRGQREIQSKLFWRTNTHRLYGNAIEACYLDNNTTSAFYFFEKSRAVLLNDQLNQLTKISTEDILKEAQLKKKIVELTRDEIGMDPGSDKNEKLQMDLFTIKQELYRTEQLIKSRNPLYFQSVIDKSGLELEDAVKTILKEHQALIEMFNGDSFVYTLIVTPNKTILKKINKIDFDSTSNLFNTYVSNQATLNANMEDFIRTAQHLFKLIFGQVFIPKGRIIISPAGSYFPFEALVTSSMGKPVNYFLTDYTISYTYSARYLLNAFSDNVFTFRNFLGLAPVHYPASARLATLTGSDLSLERLSSNFDEAEIWIKEKATRSNFLQGYINHRIIQLYTHASDSSSNGEPVIWFADSALYLSDLINENKPQARLIVLSACQTGTGQLFRGEGVFSFNRGFAAIGIPAAITNLWSIDSKSTYELTELFYKYLSDGFPTDVALQKAKLYYIQNGDKEKSLPYYWAASVLVGNTEVIQLNHSFRWTWILIIGIGLSALSIWYFLRRRKK